MMKKLTFKLRFTLVLLMVLIMFILHNSFWLWKFDEQLPLLFGFMPFAFFFFVGYAVLAVVVLFLVVAMVWPDPPRELLEPTKEEGITKQ